MSKTPGYIILILLAVAAAFAGWRSYESSVRAATEAEILKGLSAEEIALILESHFGNGSGLEALTENAEGRRKFLQGLREHLALAADARREGLADMPEFKINLEYKTNLLLADLYQTQLASDAPSFTDDELAAVWSDPANTTAFGSVMETMRSIQTETAEVLGSGITPGPLAGEGLDRAKANWAKAKLLSDKAKADDGFMNRPELKLRIKILEAGILSSDMLRTHWPHRIKATREEISNWLVEHAEFGPSVKKEAASRLLERVLAGEDISSLAKGLSEHRPSREIGGAMRNVSCDQLEPAVRAALDEMQPGETLRRLIETDLGYYILKLEIRNGPDSKNRNGEYTFRQILVQKKFPQPGVGTAEIPAPFMTAEEIAKTEIEKTKRNKFVAESIERNGISLPDDIPL